ncbi:HARBI1 family protein, partial [Nocardiopsis oceani]
MSPSITYTAVLDVQRPTAEYLAQLLTAHQETIGTRPGTRALSPFNQAVLVLRWFLDATRAAQLATDNDIGKSTVYAYLHEGIDVLASQAPDLHTALQRAHQAGHTHLNLDGTLVRTDRVAAPGPNSADLWWSGKHKHHGGNVQVVSTPDGWPLWTSPVRPGREHDTTCARAAEGLLPALEDIAAKHGVLTLADLGYLNLSPAMRTPVKKAPGRVLTEREQSYNQLIRGIHGLSERANALLKNYKALRRVSLDPWRIGAVVQAALVLLHLEHDR